MDLLKKLATMLAGGLIGLGAIAGGIAWYQMTPDARSAVTSTVLRILAWLGVVVIAPFATWFVTSWIAKKESNALGAILVFTYTAIEAVALFWLLGWTVTGSTAWMFVALGLLISAAYNLLACDWIADRLT